MIVGKGDQIDTDLPVVLCALRRSVKGESLSQGGGTALRIGEFIVEDRHIRGLHFLNQRRVDDILDACRRNSFSCRIVCIKQDVAGESKGNRAFFFAGNDIPLCILDHVLALVRIQILPRKGGSRRGILQ